MASFVEVRLPEDIERGAKGGPGFNTSIAPMGSGYEQRNSNWANARGSWDIGYGIQEKVDFKAVLGFFYARKGRAYGFRFKDWSDYEITNQSIGLGDAATVDFQLFKRYSSGGVNYDRIISKPVDGTLLVYVDAVLQTETTDYTVDYTTGIITFVSAPGAALSVNVTCEFDVPVRFDTDRIDLQLDWEDAGIFPSIPIIELRV